MVACERAKREISWALSTAHTVGSIQGKKWIMELETKKEEKIKCYLTSQPRHLTSAEISPQDFQTPRLQAGR